MSRGPTAAFRARRASAVAWALALAVACARPCAADGEPATGSWTGSGEWPGARTMLRIVPGATGFESAPTTRDEPLALLSSDELRAAAEAGDADKPALGAERVQLVLRSLTVPGWGQATLGHNGAAKVFGIVELSIWVGFATFHTQEAMRRSSTERTAELSAGIDVSDRDEEFRRIVGAFSSSDEYNRLVVFRDAANLYLSDPDHLDYDGYHAYIAAHSLGGADAWRWSGPQEQLRYREQRQAEQRAGLRANTALGLALLNRLVSVLHVARLRGAAPSETPKVGLEIAPAPGYDLTAYRVGVRARF